MNIDEYRREQNKIVSPLPPEFRGFVLQYLPYVCNLESTAQALRILQEMTDGLMGRVHDYSVRIGQGACASVADELRWRELADTSYQGDY